MTDPLFEIIFRGDIVLGNQIADVKLRLMQLFKADAGKIEELFIGVAKPLKSNLDKATAEKYKQVLAKAGALVEIKPMGSLNKTPSAAARRRASERSAALQAGKQESEASVVARSESGSRAEPNFDLAAAGEDLLNASERPSVVPVEIDVSSLSVREAEGDLLDESERTHVEELELDLSELILAEAGADILRSEDRVEVESVEVDLGGLDLAPAGSDLGQKATEPPPPPPDTSGLSLAD